MTILRASMARMPWVPMPISGRRSIAPR
jgi:hypothetical protein